jgi:hypothetical protein
MPIFCDIERFATPGGENWVALYYWFFYTYNWNVALAHEGDWEHITLYFELSRFESSETPDFIFYAAHKHGIVLKFDDARIEKEETHPIVFVSNWGHPSYPTMPDRLRQHYTVAWRTWHHEILPITSQPWALYDGAWGEVGSWGASTGPLGPYFKRKRDVVLVRRNLQ